MRTNAFEAGDVFTSRRVGGNPLAVFPDATGRVSGACVPVFSSTVGL